MVKNCLLILSVFLIGCGPKPQTKAPSNESAELAPMPKSDSKVDVAEINNSQKSVLADPRVTYSYKLGIIVEKTRVYEKVSYPDGEKTVPIINGYVPAVFVTTYPNGDSNILYDYRQRVVYQANKVDPKK